MKLANKVLLIPYSPTSEDKDFFVRWVELLKPIHNLTKTEQSVLAAILRSRHQLSKNVTDTNLLDEMCLNYSNRARIKEFLNISSQQLNYILSKIKDKGILSPVLKINGRIDYFKINPIFIPSLIEEDKQYKVLLVFQSSDVK
jgi:hypothetical protein